MNKQKGFTLVELLIVIAIIGILSAIVITSLNKARASGNDGKVKGQIANLRAATDVYYQNHGNSFKGLCSVPMGDVSGTYQLLQTSNYPVKTTLDCGDDDSVYSVAASMSGNAAWCVDSDGTSRNANAAADLYTGVTTGAHPAHSAAGATQCN